MKSTKAASVGRGGGRPPWPLGGGWVLQSGNWEGGGVGRWGDWGTGQKGGLVPGKSRMPAQQLCPRGPWSTRPRARLDSAGLERKQKGPGLQEVPPCGQACGGSLPPSQSHHAEGSSKLQVCSVMAPWWHGRAWLRGRRFTGFLNRGCFLNSGGPSSLDN